MALYLDINVKDRQAHGRACRSQDADSSGTLMPDTVTSFIVGLLDCFVAVLLAMTAVNVSAPIFFCIV